jgi:hypothetical protein
VAKLRSVPQFGCLTDSLLLRDKERGMVSLCVAVALHWLAEFTVAFENYCWFF